MPDTIANLRDLCLSYDTRTALMRNNPVLYARIKRAKLEDICFAHMPINRRRWTVEELVEEARKYSTRTEMLAESPALYQAITRRGLTQLLPPSRKGQK